MPARGGLDPQTYTSFGALLRFLRRRAQLTQRDLGIAVGYSEGHINRFEHGKHWPDPAGVAALFVPALFLNDEPELAARLIELAAQSRHTAPEAASSEAHTLTSLLEPIPPLVQAAVMRADALARLRARLTTDRRVVVCGLPGTGKTTLASDLAREFALKMPVLWFTFTAGVTNTAEAIVSQIAIFLAAQGQDAVKPLIAADPRARGSLTPDRQVALIGSALARQPALLCFDNAELIHQDEACLQILRHLSATTPAYLLLTSRESLPLAQLVEMTLSGLDAAEGRAWIAASFDRVLDDHQIDRLIEKTAGNPMLLRLVLGKLIDERTEVEPFIARLEMQPQVAAYLLQTIRKQLSPEAWRLMLLLAAFQQPIDLYEPYLVELAASLGDIAQMAEAVAELQRRRLIDDAAYAHLHPLVRDYVYRTLSLEVAVRQRLHRLAAEWFRAANQDAFTAAWHYSRAGLLESAVETIEENERVLTERGQNLAAVAILDEVEAQIKRVRTAQPDLLRRLLTRRGILLRGTLRVIEGEANLREAVQLTQTPAVRASIIGELAFVVLQRSDFRETLRLAQLARAELSSGDILLRAGLTSLEASAYGYLGQPDLATQAAQTAVALLDQVAELPQTITGEIRSRALSQLAEDARRQRDLTSAMRYSQAALSAARAAGAERSANLHLSFIGGLHYDLGDLDASFRYRQAALDGLLAIGDVHSAAYMLTYLADIHHVRLEIDLALEKSARASETLRIVNDMRGLAAAGGAHATVLLWCGEVAAARRVIDHILRETAGKGTEALWGYRLNKLATVQLVQGETAAAFATLKEAQTLAIARANIMLQFVLSGTLAIAQTVSGDYAGAAQTVAQTPPSDGLSHWVVLERDLVEGFVLFARGEVAAARLLADELARRTAPYPLYAQTARQLQAAIDTATPVSQFPRCIWAQC